MRVFLGRGRQNRGRGGAILTPNELVLTFRGSYVCANFGENRSRNASVRVLADGQTHRQTDTQTQTDFIICPVLYAISMGQIIMINGAQHRVISWEVTREKSSFCWVGTCDLE